jgi:thiosulfate reductase cytochrome b subunit
MATHDSIHPAVIRITHWLLVVSFLALAISGTAILIAHPRLYWGETGTWAMPSLADLPLPIIYGHSGWGRYLHFLAAWVCVLSGLVYILTGLVKGYIRKRLIPDAGELNWRAISSVLRDRLHWQPPAPDVAWRYNVVQRLTYLLVIFVLFPAMVWTGLAMSPAMTAQYPFLVTVLGGHQSARTVHFIVANLLLIFLLVHLVMLVRVGFVSHVQAMITGRQPQGETGP